MHLWLAWLIDHVLLYLCHLISSPLPWASRGASAGMAEWDNQGREQGWAGEWEEEAGEGTGGVKWRASFLQYSHNYLLISRSYFLSFSFLSFLFLPVYFLAFSSRAHAIYPLLIPATPVHAVHAIQTVHAADAVCRFQGGAGAGKGIKRRRKGNPEKKRISQKRKTRSNHHKTGRLSPYPLCRQVEREPFLGGQRE